MITVQSGFKMLSLNGVCVCLYQALCLRSQVCATFVWVIRTGENSAISLMLQVSSNPSTKELDTNQQAGEKKEKRKI